MMRRKEGQRHLLLQSSKASHGMKACLEMEEEEEGYEELSLYRRWTRKGRKERDIISQGFTCVPILRNE